MFSYHFRWQVSFYHCSPTLVPFFFLPRPPLPAFGVNRAGSNGVRFTLEDSPLSTSSDIAFPQAGAHAIPLYQ